MTDIETTDQDPSGDVATGGIRHDNPIPTPLFRGSRCIEHIPLRAAVPCIHRKTLYKFQWGYKAAGRSEESTGTIVPHHPQAKYFTM